MRIYFESMSGTQHTGLARSRCAGKGGDHCHCLIVVFIRGLESNDSPGVGGKGRALSMVGVREEHKPHAPAFPR